MISKERLARESYAVAKHKVDSARYMPQRATPNVKIEPKTAKLVSQN